MRNLRSVNLNLLPVLRELLRKQNVTHAAQALNISQPAASDALARLRALLKDEILIPDGRKFRLTAYARRIEKTVEDALAHIEGLVFDDPLDLSQEQGVVKIALADYVLHVVGPRLLSQIAAEAPRLTVQFVSLTPSSPQDLSMGAIDFILSAGRHPTEGFERARLFEDHFVCVVPAESPFGDVLTEEEFWAARHAAFTPGDTVLDSLHSAVLRGRERQEFNAVILQSIMLLPMAIKAADAIAVMPWRLAQTLAKSYDVRVVGMPFDLPRIQFDAYWHPQRRHDQLHDWVLRKLTALAEDPCAQAAAE